jgi:hypothetical protein
MRLCVLGIRKKEVGNMKKDGTFVLFVKEHFPGLPASGTHCIWLNILAYRFHLHTLRASTIE